VVSIETLFFLFSKRTDGRKVECFMVVLFHIQQFLKEFYNQMTINICRNDLIADNLMAIIEGKKKKVNAYVDLVFAQQS
jgi:hypothetical protein